jgi:hypothetical protein
MARCHPCAILIAMFHDVSHSNVGGHERLGVAVRLQTGSTNPRALDCAQPGLRWMPPRVLAAHGLRAAEASSRVST